MSRYRWGTGDPAAYRLATGAQITNAGTGSIRKTWIVVFNVVATTGWLHQSIAALGTNLAGAATTFIATWAHAYRTIAEVTRGAHHGRIDRTAGTVTMRRRRGIACAFAIILQLHTSIDQLA